MSSNGVRPSLVFTLSCRAPLVTGPLSLGHAVSPYIETHADTDADKTRPVAHYCCGMVQTLTPCPYGPAP